VAGRHQQIYFRVVRVIRGPWCRCCLPSWRRRVVLR
jgi:hypothetical protein